MSTIGWDVSTSAIGICVRETGKADQYRVIFPKGKTHLEKHASAVAQVKAFMAKLSIAQPIEHVVEDRLGGFTAGKTSKQTLMVLAAMNAVVSLELSYSGRVVHMAPITTKSIMKIKELMLPGEEKKDTVVRLARLSPGFPYTETKHGNWKKGVDDMADAWLLAEAWGKVQRGEATIGSAKKAKGDKGKAGGAKAHSKKKG